MTASSRAKRVGGRRGQSVGGVAGHGHVALRFLAASIITVPQPEFLKKGKNPTMEAMMVDPAVKKRGADAAV
jgi:hypothetical protein